VEHVLRTARAQGARRAGASIADLLGTDDPVEVLYRSLHVPTLLIHDDAPDHDFRRASELERTNPGVRTYAIEGTRGLPHFEKLDEVLSAIRDLHEEARRGEEAEARA
jgi:pimeloyl-ACP methyl ester carboxylesterase